MDAGETYASAVAPKVLSMAATLVSWPKVMALEYVYTELLLAYQRGMMDAKIDETVNQPDKTKN